MKLILITIILIVLNIINKSESICNAPSTGANCTSTLLYIPRIEPNETQPFLTFNIPSILSNSNFMIGSISIESINEVNSNNDQIVKRIPFTNWLKISVSNSPYKYSIKTNDLSLLIDVNWSVNKINSSLNYTNIQFNFNFTKYQFQSPSNKLSLNLVQSLFDSQISSGKSACGFSQLVSNSVYHQEVKLGDITLLGELNTDSNIDGTLEKQVLIATQLNKSTTTTTSSIETSQKISIIIPNFLNFAQFSTNYFPIKDPSPITSTFQDGTICVSAPSSKTGRTQQEVAAICVGVIGFTIIGLMALHFFYLNGRFYNKRD
ncbi:hypothetical protein ACTFIZ_011643 [Dictyostelium cf. discoideum]